MKTVRRIPTRRFILRRIARNVWDAANAFNHLPIAGLVLAVALLYVINR